MEESVVWDSSVLIPLILPRSKSFALYERLDGAGWHVAVTPPILEEVRAKLTTKEALRKWLRLGESDIKEFVDIILPALVRIYPGQVTIEGVVSADPNDDMIVAAAVESQSRYIVTEDRHLLDLGRYQSTVILSRDEFAHDLDRLGIR